MKYLLTLAFVIASCTMFSSCGESEGEATPVPRKGFAANDQPLSSDPNLGQGNTGGGGGTGGGGTTAPSMTAQIGGASFAATSVSGQVVSPLIYITGTQGSTTLVVSAESTGPGTYNLSSGTNFASVSYSSGGVSGAATSGTLTISTLANNKVSGTFSNLSVTTTTGSTIAITNGSFSATY